MNNIETMKLALEALKCLLAGNSTAHQVGNAITSLRQAIEQAQQAVDWEKLYRLEVKKKEAIAAKYEQDIKSLTKIVPMSQQAEPVAWMDDEMNCIFFDAEIPEPFDFDFWKPLYTSPPPRHPLTDKELNLIGLHWHYNLLGKDDKAELFAFARAIEVAIWEKQK